MGVALLGLFLSVVAMASSVALHKVVHPNAARRTIPALLLCWRPARWSRRRAGRLFQSFRLFRWL